MEDVGQLRVVHVGGDVEGITPFGVKIGTNCCRGGLVWLCLFLRLRLGQRRLGGTL